MRFALAIGRRGNLIVVVRKYEPYVVCGSAWGSANPQSVCRDTLDDMITDETPSVFGSDGGQGVNWLVPWDIIARKSPKTTRVKTESSRNRLTASLVSNSKFELLDTRWNLAFRAKRDYAMV